jgi:hypothetical protein
MPDAIAGLRAVKPSNQIPPKPELCFMRRKLLWAALVLLCVTAKGAVAVTVNLAPSKDNTLIQPAVPTQANPSGQLSNALGDIFVGRTNQDGQGPAVFSIRRGLEAFDIKDNVPAGATITGVTLTVRDVTGLSTTSTIELHRALQDWGEGTSFQNGGSGSAATNGDATWLYTFFNHGDPSSSPTWTTPGGSFNSTVSAAAVDSLTAAGFLTWSSAINPQMLSDVQSWLANPSGNFGWVILGNEAAGQTARRLNCRESTTSPNVAPVLSIQFTVPEPSGAVLAALCAIALAASGLRRGRRRGIHE